MKRLITVCGSLLLISPAVLLADDALYIECPVESLRAEVVTTIPEGWWSTPQSGDLVDVRVDTIGGQRTLVCAYRAFGGVAAVMREFPSGFLSCRPQGSGFECSKTVEYMPGPQMPVEEVKEDKFDMPGPRKTAEDIKQDKFDMPGPRKTAEDVKEVEIEDTEIRDKALPRDQR